MGARVLTPLARKAAAEINHQARPWLQNELQKYDNMSVQEALPKFCQISERTKNPTDEPLWKMLGFGDDGFSHDCAIIERTVDGKHARHVAVGLGSAPKRNRTDLRDLFVLLDEAIVTRNRSSCAGSSLADPVVLNSIGRAVGQHIRITTRQLWMTRPR